MINRAEFDESYANFDKEDVVEIIDLFINEYPGKMQALEDAILKLDFDKIFLKGLHLKHIVANFLDNEARSLAYEFEHKGKYKDASDLMDDYYKLKHAIEGLVEELTEIRKAYVWKDSDFFLNQVPWIA